MRPIYEDKKRQWVSKRSIGPLQQTLHLHRNKEHEQSAYFVFLTISAPSPTTDARTLCRFNFARVSCMSPGSHVLRLLYSTTTFLTGQTRTGGQETQNAMMRRDGEKWKQYTRKKNKCIYVYICTYIVQASVRVFFKYIATHNIATTSYNTLDGRLCSTVEHGYTHKSRDMSNKQHPPASYESPLAHAQSPANTQWCSTTNVVFRCIMSR